MDRLSAVEQSIYAESELSELFNTFATAFYDLAPAQAFWERMAGDERDHVLLLVFEKWRIVREDLDGARVSYDDPTLLRLMKVFDDLRASFVHPPDLKQALQLALKAEEKVLTFHEDRIFIDDFGLSDQVVNTLVGQEERHREALEKLLAAADSAQAISEFELSSLDLE